MQPGLIAICGVGARIDAPVDTAIDDRTGALVKVAGTDAQGVDFTTRFYFIRTSGEEVLVLAAAPDSM